jgi:hypothetical protein
MRADLAGSGSPVPLASRGAPMCRFGPALVLPMIHNPVEKFARTAVTVL